METWTQRDGEAGRVLIVDVRLDALEQARRERPDLVLTDVTMPGVDGSSSPRNCAATSEPTGCR
jgi:CheY-like chemotaxis protein